MYIYIGAGSTLTAKNVFNALYYTDFNESTRTVFFLYQTIGRGTCKLYSRVNDLVAPSTVCEDGKLSQRIPIMPKMIDLIVKNVNIDRSKPGYTSCHYK